MRIDPGERVDGPGAGHRVVLVEGPARLRHQSRDALRPGAIGEFLLDGQRVGGVGRQRQRLGDQRLRLVEAILLQRLPGPRRQRGDLALVEPLLMRVTQPLQRRVARCDVGERVDRGFGLVDRPGLRRFVGPADGLVHAQFEAAALQPVTQLLDVGVGRRPGLQLLQQSRGRRQLALLDGRFGLLQHLAARHRRVLRLRRHHRRLRWQHHEGVLGIEAAGDRQELALEALRALGARSRLLLQAFRDGLDQRVRHLGHEAFDRAGLFADDLARDVIQVVAPERLPAGQQFVRHRADREDVAAGVHRLAGDLLGRHVLGGAHDHAGHRHARGFVAVGDAEVEEAKGAAVLRNQQVGGLDVAMDDAAFVRVTESGTQLRQPPDFPRQGLLIAAADDLGHRPAGMNSMARYGLPSCSPTA